MSEFKDMGLKSPVLVFLLLSSVISFTAASVKLTSNGLAATVENSHAKIVFKTDAQVSSVTVNGKNIASTSEKSFYLDWNSNGEFHFNPSSLTVVEDTPSRAHFYWLQESSVDFFRIELHYVMVDGVNGIYSWAKYTNDQPSNITVAVTRTVYRFDKTVMTRANNIVRDEQLYTYAYLNNQTKIQDETWQLPDGTIYTKYDFVVYFRETPYQGVYGNGYGAFLISASRDYHGGGPLRQDLLIHQDSLILNVFTSSHLGAYGIPAPPGWTHIYGPWLIYFNTGSDSDILDDVKNRAVIEQNTWPYDFVNDSEYPIKRSTVYGNVVGQQNASVFLYDSTEEDFSAQALGYLFSTATDSKGFFSLKNIRPGNYNLVAYSLAGQGGENLAVKNLTVEAGENINIGNLTLPEPANIIWALGETNRRSSEFRYSDELRNYVWSTLPPATLTFIIGESIAANDWYYAQTKPGTWTIQYIDTKDGNSRTLRIALAAATQDPHLQVHVNGHKIADIFGSNDRAIYRSAMQSGTFSSNVLTVKSVQVISGINNVTLQLSTGQVMYDAISLQNNVS